MSSNKRPLVLVLAIIGVLFIVLGVVYLAVPAGSLPALLGHTTPANGHHRVRMLVSFVVGVVFLVGAWFANKGSRTSASRPA